MICCDIYILDRTIRNVHNSHLRKSSIDGNLLEITWQICDQTFRSQVLNLFHSWPISHIHLDKIEGKNQRFTGSSNQQLHQRWREPQHRAQNRGTIQDPGKPPHISKVPNIGGANRCLADLWINLYLVVFRQPSPLKNLSSSLGMIIFPIDGKIWKNNTCSKPPST